jgi:hypothetical protein
MNLHPVDFLEALHDNDVIVRQNPRCNWDTGYFRNGALSGTVAATPALCERQIFGHPDSKDRA